MFNCFKPSFCKQPHDLVFPFVKLDVNTTTSLPQSHLHNHFTLLFSSVPKGFIAVNLPNFLLVISFLFLSLVLSFL